MARQTQKRIGVLFGGCSGEHEVAIASAQAITKGLTQGANAEKYHVVPVYIRKDGVWQFGDIAAEVLRSGQPLSVPELDESAQTPSRLPVKSTPVVSK